MATVVKRSGGKVATKSGAKGATKSGGKSAAKVAPKAAPVATAPTNGTDKPARVRVDYAGQVEDFRTHLQGGGTMRQLKEKLGVSADTGIRAALFSAGYDSKGNPHGEQAGSIDATKAAGKKQLAKLRAEGAGWYRLAFLSGLSESDVKAVVADAGGPTGRVYVAAEKPAKAAPKSKADASANTGGSREGTGKKVTRRAVKADPS
jgi:hypothetical protein